MSNTSKNDRWSWPKIRTLITRTYSEWNAVEAPRMGASLAYYTMLSLAPLLLVAIGIASLVFGREAASGALLGQIQGLVGKEGGEAIQSILQSASQKKSSGTIAAVIGFLTLMFGASSVALELRSAMDKIWDVKAQEGMAGFIKERSYALAIVLGAGFLLMASLLVSASLATMGKFIGGSLPAPAWLLEIVNTIISIVVIAGILACLFKLLPAATIAWRDVVPGAIFTSILFTVGKTLIGVYLGKAAVGSSYGAAGSLVVLLIWIYYSAQILFFGAEFTRVYGQEYGSQPKPQPAPQGKPAPPSVESLATANGGQGNTGVSSGSGSLVGSVAQLIGSLTGFALFTVKVLQDESPKEKSAPLRKT